MADESFDVIISDQEYKQLKLQHQTNAELTLKIANIQAKLEKSEARERQLQQQLAYKDLEICYLVDLILGVASESEQRVENDLQTLNSGMFEVLGQSVLEPQKAEQSRKNSLLAGFAKKHAVVVKKVTALDERLEIQQALITKLNNLQCEKSEALVNQQATILADAEQKVKISQSKRKELESIIKALKEEIEALKQDITETMKRDKKLESSSLQMNKQLKREVHRLKAQNDILAQKLKNQMDRLHQLEMENAVLRQGLGSSFPKEETRDHIRRLIEEYAREVQRSLRSIEGLSAHEINDLMRSEMKQLVDCIPNAALGRK